MKKLAGLLDLRVAILIFGSASILLVAVGVAEAAISSQLSQQGARVGEALDGLKASQPEVATRKQLLSILSSCPADFLADRPEVMTDAEADALLELCKGPQTSKRIEVLRAIRAARAAGLLKPAPPAEQQGVG